MVLQAGAPSQIWGAAEAGSAIKVQAQSLAVDLNTKSNASGLWQVEWPSLPATTKSFAIQIYANYPDGSGTLLELEDVLIGTLIVCSGQSNMEYPLELALNASEAIADSSNYPLLRVLQIATPESARTASEPQTNATASIPWSVSSPSAVASFSGTCYFMGRDLFRSQPAGEQMPVGIIDSCLGGSWIESWMSTRALRKCPGSQSQKPYPPANTTSLWYSKIWPLLPLSVRAVLWDQGESNVQEPQLYNCELPVMAQDWRAWWASTARPHGPALPELDVFPFAYRQLHAYPTGGMHAAMRLAMAAAEGGAPWMAYYTSYDIGNMSSPWGNIHFPDKQEAGRRAAIALGGMIAAQDSTETSVKAANTSVFHGPELASVVVVSYGDPKTTPNKRFFAVDLHFDQAGIDNPLQLPLGGQPPYSGIELLLGTGLGVYNDTCDGLWVPTLASLTGPSTVRLNASLDLGSAAVPLKVRYGTMDWPIAGLKGTTQSLPARPFEADIPPEP